MQNFMFGTAWSGRGSNPVVSSARDVLARDVICLSLLIQNVIGISYNTLKLITLIVALNVNKTPANAVISGHLLESSDSVHLKE